MECVWYAEIAEKLQAAHERGIDVLLRAEMVQRLLAGRHTLRELGVFRFQTCHPRFGRF